MAITRLANRGSFTSLSGSTSSTLTVSASLTKWNLATLRLAISNANGTGTSVTTVNIVDPRGNVWEKFQVANGQGVVNDGVESMLAYSLQETPLLSGDVLTLQFFTSSGMTTPLSVIGKACVLEEWSGTGRGAGGNQIHATSLLARGDNTTVVDSDIIGNTPTGYLILTALGIEGPAADAFTTDPDTDGGVWVHAFAAGTAAHAENMTIEGDYKITTSQVSQRYQPTLGTARDWALRLITIRPVPEPSGNFTAPLPALTGAGTGEVQVEASFAATLPGPITGAFTGEVEFIDGALTIVLGALVAEFIGQQPDAIGGQFDAVLPELQAHLDGQRPGAAFLEATLPAIEALFELERQGTDGAVDVRRRRGILDSKAFPTRWPGVNSGRRVL